MRGGDKKMPIGVIKTKQHANHPTAIREREEDCVRFTPINSFY